jgi:hypothetical protein
MMEAAAYSIAQEPDHSVEIVVHVDETLPEVKRADMVNALQDIDGIISAEFCPLRHHLMLVRYDRETFSSSDVLGKVHDQDVHAELIGPV